MAHTVSSECVACGACVDTCPVGAITMEDKAVVDALLSILNICQAGDSIISTPEIYGGTINLFSFTLKKLGIECIYVDKNMSDDEIKACFKENTKLVFGETIANPALTVFDIERFANIAHAMGTRTGNRRPAIT